LPTATVAAGVGFGDYERKAIKARTAGSAEINGRPQRKVLDRHLAGEEGGEKVREGTKLLLPVRGTLRPMPGTYYGGKT